jgi:mono/diheme cytochrome c family protein
MWRRRRAAAVRSAARWILLAALLGPSACGGDQRKVASSAAPDVPAGKTIYETRCSPCHGIDGRGDGPAAAAIDPKPRNFRDPAFWQGRTAQQLRLVVKQGKPGTLMAPFEGALSDAEIDDVVAYVQSFRPSGS